MNKEQDQREQRKRARVCDRGADKAGQHRERERERRQWQQGSVAQRRQTLAMLFVLVLILCANNCLIVSGRGLSVARIVVFVLLLFLLPLLLLMQMASHISYTNPFSSINWQPSAAAGRNRTANEQNSWDGAWPGLRPRVPLHNN